MVYWGRFQVIWFPSERSSDSSYSAAIAKFSNFIFMQGLVDIPLVGVIYLVQ